MKSHVSPRGRGARERHRANCEVEPNIAKRLDQLLLGHAQQAGDRSRFWRSVKACAPRRLDRTMHRQRAELQAFGRLGDQNSVHHLDATGIDDAIQCVDKFRVGRWTPRTTVAIAPPNAGVRFSPRCEPSILLISCFRKRRLASLAAISPSCGRTSPLMPDKTREIVGKVGHADLHLGAHQADGADEQPHWSLLTGKDMLDFRTDRRAPAIGT